MSICSVLTFWLLSILVVDQLLSVYARICVVLIFFLFQLWISYFQRSGTLPAPFFLLPTVKHLMMLVGWIRKQAIKELQELESRETTMKLNRVMRDNERKYQVSPLEEVTAFKGGKDKFTCAIMHNFSG